MARKGCIGKTCAYCSEEGVSAVREHVVCKEFFLEQDRGNLPMVPACEGCNTAKSKLETYALAVLPFGSFHENAMDYLRKNMQRRLRKNPTLKRQLSKGATRLWGQPGDVFASTSALPADDQRINELLAMIVRGLFMHDFGDALHKYWSVRVTMSLPSDEVDVLNQVLRLLGQNPRHVRRNLGRGTFNYEGYSSRMMRNCSVWQFTLFAGLAVADDEIALSRFSAITTRRDDVQGPLSEKEFSRRG
jgi:hypothetical protein